MATNPTTATTDSSSIAEGLRPLKQSNTTQVIIAVADAVFVFKKLYSYRIGSQRRSGIKPEPS